MLRWTPAVVQPANMLSTLRWMFGSLVLATHDTWASVRWLRASWTLTTIYVVVIGVLLSPLWVPFLVLELWDRMISLATAVSEVQAGFDDARPGPRVGTFNIQSCIGSDCATDVARVARALNAMRLDIVAIQEVDSGQLSDIARATGLEHFEFCCTRGCREHGIAILSRAPIVERRVAMFERWWGREQRGFLLVRVDASRLEGEEPFLWFGSAHLQNDVSGLEPLTQLKQLGQAVPHDFPCVVGLDANMMGWKLVRAAASCGLVEQCGPSYGATFPATWPLYRLDGLLTRHGSGVIVAFSEQVAGSAAWDDVTAAFVSDHLPVCGTLHFGHRAAWRPDQASTGGMLPLLVAGGRETVCKC